MHLSFASQILPNEDVLYHRYFILLSTYSVLHTLKIFLKFQYWSIYFSEVKCSISLVFICDFADVCFAVIELYIIELIRFKVIQVFS